MVTEIVGVLSSLLGGILGNEESKDLAEEIRKQQLSMPPEMQIAEAQAQKMSFLGMPGYDAYREQVGELMPTTLNQAKEFANSPSSLIDMASKTMNVTNRAYNDLFTKDAQSRIENMRNYQSVLMQKGALQSSIDSKNVETRLAAIAQEAQGTKDLWQGITNAAGGLVGMESSWRTDQYQKEYMDMLNGYFGETPSFKSTDPNYSGGQFPSGQTSPSSYSQPIDPMKSISVFSGSSPYNPIPEMKSFSYEDMMNKLLQQELIK